MNYIYICGWTGFTRAKKKINRNQNQPEGFSSEERQNIMNFLGNIFWLILGGFITALLYFTAGLLMCITIIGIPFGVQLIKFGIFALMPFGHEVSSKDSSGCLSTVFNILWILCGWWEIALVHLVFGLVFCITIIGIPFGLQHFKIAGFSLLPFGRTIN